MAMVVAGTTTTTTTVSMRALVKMQFEQALVQGRLSFFRHLDTRT